MTLKTLWKLVRMAVFKPRLFAKKTGLMAQPTKQLYRERFEMTLGDWLRYQQREVIFDRCTWMGVRALKNPLDAWVYQEVIYETKPDVIVEVGSMWGGSTLFYAHLLDLIGKGTVISIDIDRTRYSAEHDRIVCITGSSAAPEVIARVHELCEGKSALVIHDGDHRKGPVLADLRAYSDLVPVGGYLIIEDGVMDVFDPGDGIGAFDEGPLAATEEFLRETSDFIVDEERERYIATYNPLGFLKRVSR